MYNKLSGFSDEIASDVTTQFTVLKKLEIKYFEPRGINGKNIAELSDDEVLALKEKMAAYGIQASSIGSPIGKIRLTDDFNAHFEAFKRVVKTAKILNSRFIRVFSFYHDNEEWTAEERQAVLRRLKQLIAYAEEENVVLLHENEKDIYGDTIARCLDLMQELSGNHFKAVFDPANFVQCGQDTKKAYHILKDFIAYVHIKDACAKDGIVLPAGYGDGNIPYILDNLFASGFNGFLSLEPHLGSFEGLAALELTDTMQDLPKGGEATFTLAYNALKKFL